MPRSYSRQIGAISCESETDTSVAERLADGELVVGVQVREEEAHGHREVAVGVAAVLGDGRAHLVGVERAHDGALGVESLVDADAVPAARERGGLAPREVVVVLAVDPLDVRDVLEALRGEEEDARAAAREDGVDADRRPDDDEGHVPWIELGLLEGGGERLDGPRRVRGDLRDVPRAAVLVDGDEVREGASRVDAYANAHVPNPQSVVLNPASYPAAPPRGPRPRADATPAPARGTPAGAPRTDPRPTCGARSAPRARPGRRTA